MEFANFYSPITSSSLEEDNFYPFNLTKEDLNLEQELKFSEKEMKSDYLNLMELIDEKNT